MFIRRFGIALTIGVVLLVTSCASVPGRTTAPKAPLPPGSYEVFGQVYQVMQDSAGYADIGVASWYDSKFHGRLTANGEKYDMYALSAAHKSLPLPTFVRVINLDNGREVILRVNDRGPFHDDRLIDLSYAAARELGFADAGTAPVVVEALDERNYPALGQLSSQEKHFYLQVGAFAQAVSARQLAERIRQVMASNQLGELGVRILESEREDAVLHKVWIGPLVDATEKDRVSGLLTSNRLGEPIPVALD